MESNQSSLRTHFLQRRSYIPAEYKQAESVKLAKKCRILIRKNEYKTVALYLHTKDEPNISTIIEDLADLNIVFCVPKIVSENQMEFYAVSSLADVKKGAFGILEPKKTCPIVDPLSIDLIFVPAVSLDTHNNRIGMGKGFYDRYLLQAKNAYKVGVVFASQISPEDFVVNSWDVPMDANLQTL